MKKKIWILIVLFTVIGIGGFLLSKKEKGSVNTVNNNIANQELSEKKHEFIYGKTDGFNSLEELENASECIVRVKKESEDEAVVSRDHGTFGYTMGQVKIQDVFLNVLEDEIQKDKIIEIWENEFPDGDVICHLEGYEKMEIGKEYLLFLRKSMTDDCFIPLGVTYGKVSVVEEPDSEFIKLHAANMDPNVKTIAVQAREKYVQ